MGGNTSVGGGGPIIVGGAGPGFPPCTAPKLDSATGLVTCQEGYRHRVAPSGAWLAQRDWTPATSHLTRAERTARAEHWMKMGQMEHASIAAFARFSLQLLSLGAPPALVEACTQA
ncbi:MAG TPA: hypothetical protein VJN18_19860 [Polyangiaceae bacterium]|nr:hypothetical protein [Polyangiaceae bacterium]